MLIENRYISANALKTRQVEKLLFAATRDYCIRMYSPLRKPGIQALAKYTRLDCLYNTDIRRALRHVAAGSWRDLQCSDFEAFGSFLPLPLFCLSQI